jgi:hypothetical protein
VCQYKDRHVETHNDIAVTNTKWNVCGGNGREKTKIPRHRRLYVASRVAPNYCHLETGRAVPSYSATLSWIRHNSPVWCHKALLRSKGCLWIPTAFTLYLVLLAVNARNRAVFGVGILSTNVMTLESNRTRDVCVNHTKMSFMLPAQGWTRCLLTGLLTLKKQARVIISLLPHHFQIFFLSFMPSAIQPGHEIRSSSTYIIWS